MNGSDQDELNKLKPVPSFYHCTSRGWPADEVDGEIDVPTLDELKALCAGLPDDCMADGLGADGSGKVCKRYSCRVCGPELFRSAVISAFATAVNRKLLYRVTVLPTSDAQPCEHAQVLSRYHHYLMKDGRKGAGHAQSFICTFSRDCKGSMRLELLTNVDFRRGIGPAKGRTLDLMKLGRTCRQLRDAHLIKFSEIGRANVRSEILSMVKGVIGLLSSGTKPLWEISSSLDIGISKVRNKAKKLAAAPASTGSAEAA